MYFFVYCQIDVYDFIVEQSKSLLIRSLILYWCLYCGWKKYIMTIIGAANNWYKTEKLLWNECNEKSLLIYDVDVYMYFSNDQWGNLEMNMYACCTCENVNIQHCE